jgi:TRAP-type C4-dicarboxylate transport system substrate-binding protein
MGKLLDQAAAEVARKTENRVKVTYFFGGKHGDEREAVRKMKLGHLHGAALTGVGLGQIQSSVRVLELPFLFKDAKEVDHVRGKLATDFEKDFDRAGYALFAWFDVGWVHT